MSRLILKKTIDLGEGISAQVRSIGVIKFKVDNSINLEFEFGDLLYWDQWIEAKENGYFSFSTGGNSYTNFSYHDGVIKFENEVSGSGGDSVCEFRLNISHDRMLELIDLVYETFDWEIYG